jgi:hypothetical protein
MSKSSENMFTFYSIEIPTTFLSTFSVLHIKLQLRFRLSIIELTQIHTMFLKNSVLALHPIEKQNIGCYGDNYDRAMPAAGKHESDVMTPQYCVDRCARQVSQRAND